MAEHRRLEGRGNTSGQRKFRDIQDGLSATIAMGEIGTSNGNRSLVGNMVMRYLDRETIINDPGANCGSGPAVDPERPQFYSEEYTGNQFFDRRGARWCNGGLNDSAFHTVLPPNSASCSWEPDWGHGLHSAGSRHEGGCHVLMADGAVRFITESIDSGNQNAPMVYSGSANVPGSKSPYGVWGALGTIASKETEGLPE